MKWRITRLGAVILVVLAACALVSVFASGPAQSLAIVVAALVVLLIAGEGINGRGARSTTRKAEVLLKRYRGAQPPGDLGPTMTPEERDALWAEARDRRKPS